jgi:hypothetical protein
MRVDNQDDDQDVSTVPARKARVAGQRAPRRRPFVIYSDGTDDSDDDAAMSRAGLVPQVAQPRAAPPRAAAESKEDAHEYEAVRLVPVTRRAVRPFVLDWQTDDSNDSDDDSDTETDASAVAVDNVPAPASAAGTSTASRRPGAGVDERMRQLAGQFRRSVHSLGSNNSPQPAALKRILSAMGVNATSVFCDLGCGVGLPSIYAALMTGCTTYGVDYAGDLVTEAKAYAAQAGVSRLCTFTQGDILELTPAWFDDRGVTHVYTFDEVFLPAVYKRMHDCVTQSRTVQIVASTTAEGKRRKKARAAWSGTQVAKVRFVMLGGTSGHTMYVYQLVR